MFFHLQANGRHSTSSVPPLWLMVVDEMAELAEKSRGACGATDIRSDYVAFGRFMPGSEF